MHGEDFDQRVIDYRGNNHAVQKLRREVENAKHALNSQYQARIEIESFYDGEDFSETFTHARFEERQVFSTATDSQPTGTIQVFEGE